MLIKFSCYLNKWHELISKTVVQSICSSWIKDKRYCWNELYFIAVFFNFPFVYTIITCDQSQNCTYSIFCTTLLYLLFDNFLLFPIIQTQFFFKSHTIPQFKYSSLPLYSIISFPVFSFLAYNLTFHYFSTECLIFRMWMLYFSYVSSCECWSCPTMKPRNKEGSEQPFTDTMEPIFLELKTLPKLHSACSQCLFVKPLWYTWLELFSLTVKSTVMMRYF